MNFKRFAMILGACGLIVAGIMLGMQQPGSSSSSSSSVPATPTPQPKTPASLERLAMDTMIGTFTRQTISNLAIPIDNKVAALRQKLAELSISESIADLAISHMAQIIFANNTLNNVQKVYLVLSLIVPEGKVGDSHLGFIAKNFARLFSAQEQLTGKKEYAKDESFDLFKAIQQLDLSNEQRAELLAQIVLHIVLSKNTWTKAHKLAFLKNLNHMVKQNVTWPTLSSSEGSPTKRQKGAPLLDEATVRFIEVLMGELEDEKLTNDFFAGSILDAGTDDESTTLHKLVITEHPLAIALALELGASINSVNAGGASALTYAAGMNHNSIIPLLLEHGALVQINDVNALIDAVTGSNEQAVSLLLQLANKQISDDALEAALEESEDVANNPETIQEDKNTQVRIKALLETEQKRRNNAQ
jgi:hypothetical protein